MTGPLASLRGPQRGDGGPHPRGPSTRACPPQRRPLPEPRRTAAAGPAGLPHGLSRPASQSPEGPGNAGHRGMRPASGWRAGAPGQPARHSLSCDPRNVEVLLGIPAQRRTGGNAHDYLSAEPTWFLHRRQACTTKYVEENYYSMANLTKLDHFKNGDTDSMVAALAGLPRPPLAVTSGRTPEPSRLGARRARHDRTHAGAVTSGRTPGPSRQGARRGRHVRTHAVTSGRMPLHTAADTSRRTPGPSRQDAGPGRHGAHPGGTPRQVCRGLMVCPVQQCLTRTYGTDSPDKLLPLPFLGYNENIIWT